MTRRLLLLTLLLFAACRREAPSVCYDCFWEHQPEGLREKVAQYYEEASFPDPLADAERQLIYGRISGETKSICGAYLGFAYTRDADPERDLYAAESAAFLARECEGDVASKFARAAELARKANDPLKSEVYASLAREAFEPRFGETRIGHALTVPADATTFILGASKIAIANGTRVTMQGERTVRDWLSYQLHDDYSTRPAKREYLVDWHEGARLRELMTVAAIDAHPARGTLAVRRGEQWFAADDQGVFRYEILPDKIRYPSTRVHGDVALLMDTHGVAAIARDALRRHAQLAIACGDHPSKMQAAYRLASSGVDVWFPCDRFVGEILGHDAKGVLVGSAPLRAEGDHAVVGDTPVAFRLDETIVVQDAATGGVTQYYDAAGRYFRALSRLARLRLEFVTVDAEGQAARVIERAQATGAKAVALRVANAADAAPVRAWLAASPERRAVLFHTAPYPQGIALFREFPNQTTFGDPRPQFR